MEWNKIYCHFFPAKYAGMILNFSADEALILSQKNLIILLCAGSGGG
jgi:hypothetical protein